MLHGKIMLLVILVTSPAQFERVKLESNSQSCEFPRILYIFLHWKLFSRFILGYFIVSWTAITISRKPGVQFIKFGTNLQDSSHSHGRRVMFWNSGGVFCKSAQSKGVCFDPEPSDHQSRARIWSAHNVNRNPKLVIGSDFNDPDLKSPTMIPRARSRSDEPDWFHRIGTCGPILAAD